MSLLLYYYYYIVVQDIPKKGSQILKAYKTTKNKSKNPNKQRNCQDIS